MKAELIEDKLIEINAKINYDDFPKFFKVLEPEEYVIRIAYKYKHETVYNESSELLIWWNDINSFEWLTDWWEGQQDIIIKWYIPLADLKFKLIVQ